MICHRNNSAGGTPKALLLTSYLKGEIVTSYTSELVGLLKINGLSFSLNFLQKHPENCLAIHLIDT